MQESIYNIPYEKLELFFERIEKKNLFSYLEMKTISSKEINIFSSKIGGLPFVQNEKEIPGTNKNQLYVFYAQINFSEIPRDFLKDQHIVIRRGLLQFWIHPEFGSYETRFIENDSFGIEKEEIQRIFYGKDMVFEQKIIFDIKKQIPSWGDFQFFDILKKEWNALLKKYYKIEDIYDLDESIQGVLQTRFQKNEIKEYYMGKFLCSDIEDPRVGVEFGEEEFVNYNYVLFGIPKQKQYICINKKNLEKGYFTDIHVCD